MAEPPQGKSVNLTLFGFVPSIAYVEKVPVQSRENVIGESISFAKVITNSREVVLGDQVITIGMAESTSSLFVYV